MASGTSGMGHPQLWAALPGPQCPLSPLRPTFPFPTSHRRLHRLTLQRFNSFHCPHQIRSTEEEHKQKTQPTENAPIWQRRAINTRYYSNENQNSPEHKNSSATDEQKRGHEPLFRPPLLSPRSRTARLSARRPFAQRRCTPAHPRPPAAPARASSGEGVGMGPAAPSSPFLLLAPSAQPGLPCALQSAHTSLLLRRFDIAARSGTAASCRAHGAASAPPGGRAEPAARRRTAAPPATPPALFTKPLAPTRGVGRSCGAVAVASPRLKMAVGDTALTSDGCAPFLLPRQSGREKPTLPGGGGEAVRTGRLVPCYAAAAPPPSGERWRSRRAGRPVCKWGESGEQRFPLARGPPLAAG